MQWAVTRIAVLILALLSSQSACFLVCSAQSSDHASPPPCHQKHGAKTCGNVLPVADVAAHTAAPHHLVVIAGILTTAPLIPATIATQPDPVTPPLRPPLAPHVLRL